MKHKLTIKSRRFGGPPPNLMWYMRCECGEEHRTMHKYPNGNQYWGRPTWEAAFALGIAHQQQADLAERLNGVFR